MDLSFCMRLSSFSLVKCTIYNGPSNQQQGNLETSTTDTRSVVFPIHIYMVSCVRVSFEHFSSCIVFLAEKKIPAEHFCLFLFVLSFFFFFSLLARGLKNRQFLVTKKRNPNKVSEPLTES